LLKVGRTAILRIKLLHARILSPFKLELVDIAIGIANARRDKSIRTHETLRKRHELGTKSFDNNVKGFAHKRMSLRSEMATGEKQA
jgi:hypothetical protein